MNKQRRVKITIPLNDSGSLTISLVTDPNVGVFVCVCMNILHKNTIIYIFSDTYSFF